MRLRLPTIVYCCVPSAVLAEELSLEPLSRELTTLFVAMLLFGVPVLLAVFWRLRVKARHRSERREMKRRNKIYAEWLRSSTGGEEQDSSSK